MSNIHGGGPLIYDGDIYLIKLKGSSHTDDQIAAIVADLVAKHGKGEWNQNVFKIRDIQEDA